MNLKNPNPNEARRPDCEAITAILTDALDNNLSPEERAAFDRHIAACPDCAATVAEAQQGVAWLELLRSPRPQPSDDLMARIIEQTSGGEINILHPALAAGVSALLGVQEIPFRQRFMVQLRAMGNVLVQPRLAMTGAMAFFSIALTMNIAGVRLRDVSLRPSSIQRGFSQAETRAVQFYDNLGVVNDLESRVQDVEQMNGNNKSNQNQQQPAAPQDQPQQPAAPNGSSYRQAPEPASPKGARA